MGALIVLFWKVLGNIYYLLIMERCFRVYDGNILKCRMVGDGKEKWGFRLGRGNRKRYGNDIAMDCKEKYIYFML